MGDLAAILVLLCLSVAVGIVNLDQGRNKIGTDFHESSTIFVPSAMFARGYGLVNVKDYTLAALDEFFTFKRGELSAELPADKIHAAPYDTFQALHINMVFFVGLIWCIFGVSWVSIKWLLAFVLAFSAIIAYKIFRLGMGRCISFFAALLFVLSPAVLLSMHSLRSLSKMFFILAVILVLGQLIKHPPARRGYWWRAICAGALIGVGAGFRQDTFVCLLPSILIFASCPGGKTRRGIVERATAIGLLLLSWLVCVSPVLHANREYGTPSHDMVMGFSEECISQLGLYPASYSMSYMARDNFVVAGINNHARRTENPDVSLRNITAAYNRAGIRFVVDNFLAFPADFVTRGCAAVLRGVTRCDWPRPTLLGAAGGTPANASPYDETRFWGLAAAAAAILLFFGHSWYRGASVLFLLLYFLGYTSILFNERHFFHLGFIPLWFAGYCIHQAISALRSDRRKLLFSRLCPPSSWSTPATKRMLAATLCVALLAAVPFYGVRLWQNRQMSRMRTQYAAAELTPIDAPPQKRGNCVLFSVTQPLSGRHYAYNEMVYPAPMPTPGDYLVAKFKSSPKWRHFRICYALSDFASDFSWTVSMPPETSAAGGSSSCFFPVYETATAMNTTEGNDFVGIAVSAEDAEAFLGLYRVENAGEFRLWPVFVLPGNEADFEGYRAMGLLPFRRQDDVTCTMLDGMRLMTPATDITGDDAAKKAATLLAQDPYNTDLYLRLGSTLEQMNDTAAAVDIYERGLSVMPKTATFYVRLARIWRSNGDGAKSVSEWNALALAHPDDADVFYWLGRAYQEANDREKARAAYEKAAQLDPSVAAFHRALGNVLLMDGSQERGLSCLTTAASLAPTDLDIAYDRASALQIMGEAGQALECLQKLQRLSPESLRCADKIDDCFKDMKESAGRTSFWRKFTEDHAAVMVPRLHLGMALEDSGDLSGAFREYSRLHDADPESVPVLLRLGGALLASGNTEQGNAVLGRVLLAAPTYTVQVADVYAGLANRLFDAGKFAEAAHWHRKAAETAPSVLWYRVHLAEALEAQHLYDEAVGEYRRVLLSSLESPSSVQRLDAIFVQHKTPPERIALWREIAAAHPDSAIPCFYLGMALETSGDAAGALAEYRRAHDVDSKSIPVLIRLGGALLAAGDAEQGKETLEQALKADPNCAGQIAGAYAGLAERLSGENRHAEAADWYRKAIELAPSVFWHRVHLAQSLEKLELHVEAAGEYRTVLLEAPESPDSARRLDAIYTGHKTPQERVALWREIAAAHPEAVIPSLYLGTGLDASGDAVGALAEYRRAYGSDPKSVPVLVHLGGALLAAGEVDQGKAMLDQALQADSNSAGQIAEAYASLANLLSKEGKPAEAADWYRKAMNLAPSVLWHRIHLAETLEKLQLYGEAAGEYRDILMTAPESPASAERLDNILVQHRTPQERIALWREIAAAHPEAATPSIHLGMALDASGDAPGALDEYRRAHNADPANALALIRLGSALLVAGDLEQGKQMLEQASGMNQDYSAEVAEAYAGLANRLSGEGKNAEAADWYRKAISVAPSVLWHRVHLADTLEKLQLYGDAAREYRSVLMEAPESPASAQELDAICTKHKTPGERVALWKEIAAAHPEAATPFLHLGMALDASGDAAGALAEYRRAHGADPKNVPVMVRLGAALFAAGDLDLGKAMLEQALHENADYAAQISEVYAGLANRLSNEGKNAEAIDWYRTAAGITPSALSHRIQLAEALEKQQLYDDAAREYRSILLEAPESPASAQSLDSICVKHKTQNERVALWREIAAAHPDAQVPARFLKMAGEGGTAN